MKKVLHLRSSSNFWGPERQISQLIEPMRRRGYEVEVVVLYRRRPELPAIHPLVTTVRQKHGQAIQLNGRWRDLPGTVATVAKMLRQGGISLLHTHEYKSDIIGGMAAKLAGVPAVASVRGYTDRTWPLRVYKRVDFLALRWFDRALPVADYVRRQLLAGGLPDQRVKTVYDAIDPQSFTSGADSGAIRIRRELGLGDAVKVVSMVGRLSPEKGHHFFLEGARQILDVFPETRFLIAGTGPERDRLKSLAVDLGVDRAVSFLGYRSDVAAIMAISDVFVLASLREGCPNVLLEAMSLARPVVATAVGGVTEIVRHGESGVLVSAKDSGAIAQAILRFLRDPAWAEQLGDNGREAMMHNFHIDVLAQELSTVYQEVLDGRPIAASAA